MDMLAKYCVNYQFKQGVFEEGKWNGHEKAQSKQQLLWAQILKRVVLVNPMGE
ncbi:hypothetical protein VCR4J2_50107 [Vibrio coralliirubri]|nr:hypothetical protein VCR4J2_50107 [Vibrio coralliirubri]